MKKTPPSAQTELEIHKPVIEIMKKNGFGLLKDGETFYKLGYELDPRGNTTFTMNQAYEIHKALSSERTRLLSVESMKMEPETYIEPCENCGGEGYGRAWTGHGRETGSAFGDRYEPTHSFVFCKECAPQFTIGKDWMGEEIWKRTSDREEHAQIRINSITHVSKEAKARNLLRQSILSEMEKGSV